MALLPAAAGTQEAARRGGVCGHDQGWVGFTDILAPGWSRRESKQSLLHSDEKREEEGC